MNDVPIQIEVGHGVATVAFNRPEAMNALDTATKSAFLSALSDVAADRSIRCLVITGRGRAFCVGQDLREHATALAEHGPQEVWATVPEHYSPIARALHGLDKPVIAAVNGVAAGAGASIAFLADLRIVAASAGFNLAFAGVGLSCDTGCSWTLPRLVGPTRALELLYLPRTVPAEEALHLGIATEVVPDAEFAVRVAALAARLAAGPTLAYAAIRQSVAFASTHALSESLAVEAEMMARTGSSADHAAAVQAFLAKRRPVFTGQ